jgi:cbb3-type cytochrome oxidase maturation protein
MSILYLLIPLAVGLMVVAIAFFLWTVRTGQYDDLEGPAHRILMDDDDPMIPHNARPKKPARQPGNEKTGAEPAAGKENRGANDNATD